MRHLNFVQVLIGRREFIHKLGVVTDLLELLPSQSDPDRIAIIKQNIAKELRELAAKHSLPDLTALARGDKALELLLAAVLRRMASEQLGDVDAAKVLTVALRPFP